MDVAGRLTAMVRDVARLVNRPAPFSDVLQGCAQSIVNHLDAAFARIWIFNGEENMLELVASAGLYTALHGKYSRIPLGEIKIGLIGLERKPQLTNDVQHDDRISDRNWARRNNIIAFAGYPLLVEEELIGVVALFSTSLLGDETLLCLESIADNIAGFIKRKRLEGQQRLSHAIFEDFVYHSRDVFWIATIRPPKFTYVSPAFEKVFEMPAEYVYANYLSFLSKVHPEDAPLVAGWVDDALANPRAIQFDFRIVQNDGSIRYLWARVFPLEDLDGKTTRLAGIAHDITERRQAELRVTQFYSTVSHELRTPLSSIKGALSLIENNRVNEDEARELIQIAGQNCDRLIRLVNDILDLRKIEAGKLRLRLKSMDLRATIAASIQSLASLAHEKAIALNVVDIPAIALSADNDRIVQVFTNLIGNAIKFCPPNSKVVVSARLIPEGVRCEVADNGPGIKSCELDKLFNLFQQLDSSDTREGSGTGLGLAISKAIIEKHGGRIGVESTVGKGSTFWFELPCETKTWHKIA